MYRFTSEQLPDALIQSRFGIPPGRRRWPLSRRSLLVQSLMGKHAKRSGDSLNKFGVFKEHLLQLAKSQVLLCSLFDFEVHSFERMRKNRGKDEEERIKALKQVLLIFQLGSHRSAFCPRQRRAG